ncbi:MAG: aldo/keto reductase [Lachnospiraceae bacterium]|nr:aldo/keto reductase [Lachnospiraceae bacterium]
MQYRKNKNGDDWSVLGYGCMRFSKNGTSIDLDKAEQELMEAYRQGINYYDTAYIYQGSEEALGKILEKNGIREQICIATKLPHYLLKDRKKAEEMFKTQLKRLRTNYIDNYLMHMLTDVDTWKHLEENGVRDFLEEKKAEGTIKNIGFSFHGNTDAFLKILDAYDWDFCQIQYNYIDEISQAGRTGLEEAQRRGIPVIIMEPLRGGKLANVPEEAKKLIADYEKRSEGTYSAAKMGLRWLYDQPGVTVVLSGMNSLEMVQENVKTAAEALPGCMSDDERALVEQVKTIIQKNTRVGCTGCRYCMPCPAGIDIPATFFSWNTMASEGKKTARAEYLRTSAMATNTVPPSKCVGCGKCEKICPQQLPIRKLLKEADHELRPFYLRAAEPLIKKLMRR